MKEKYNEINIENLLKSLKHKEVTPSDTFTSNIMHRIRNDSNFDENIAELDKVSDMLDSLSFIEDTKPSDTFTNDVMARIKSEHNIKYDKDNIDDVLKLLSKQPIILPKNDFTNKVMTKINELDYEDNITSFEKVYKKFLIGSAVVAAAAILLAFNLFSNYNPAMAEFIVTDYFNTGLYI